MVINNGNNLQWVCTINNWSDEQFARLSSTLFEAGYTLTGLADNRLDIYYEEERDNN